MCKRLSRVRILSFPLLVCLTMGSCFGPETKPDEGGKKPAGKIKVNVYKQADGDGYTPKWAPLGDDQKPLVVGLHILGWIIDATWEQPADVASRCPEGTAVVQVILSLKHTWRAGLNPSTLAGAQKLFPDVENSIDLPAGPGNPTYKGSLRLPNFGQATADVPGVDANGAKLLARLEGKFETCVVCKPGWQPLSCIRWGFVADYTQTPPKITGADLEDGTGSPRFQEVLQEFLHR